MHNIPHHALIVVADGNSAKFFRNSGNERKVSLSADGEFMPAHLDQDGPLGMRPKESSARETDEATFAKQLAHDLYRRAHKGECSIDTSTASGELHFHMLAALAQFERGLIRERVNAGLEAAWASGKKSGRKGADHPDKIAALATAKARIQNGMSVTLAAAQSGIARATVYKYIAEKKTDKPDKQTRKQTIYLDGSEASAGVRQ